MNEVKNGQTNNLGEKFENSSQYKGNSFCNNQDSMDSSTKRESLLLTFSGNAFPGSESLKKETSIHNNLPSPQTSLTSNGNSPDLIITQNSRGKKGDSSTFGQSKKRFFANPAKMCLPVKVKPISNSNELSKKSHKKSPSNQISQANSHQNSNQEYFSTKANPFHSTLDNGSFKGKFINFEEESKEDEEKFDFNEFLQDSSNHEPSPDILQRLIQENEQLKEKTRNNEEMVKNLLS